MSEYFFGTGRGTVKAALKKRCQRIAEKHGADFTTVTLGDGPRFWFSCPNRGNPFDRNTERAVFADLDAAGLSAQLWPEVARG